MLPYLITSIREGIDDTLHELVLPKSLKAVELSELHLGRRPPVVKSLAAVAAAGPTAEPSRGCLVQLEIEWEAPDASATLAFRLANVASTPKLLLRRPRLRGTLRLHWEWIRQEPYVGIVRVAFVRAPDVADVALEPLGTLDVTTLPGLGTWIREQLNSAILSSVCLPNWVESDVRLTLVKSRERKAAAAAAAAGAVAAVVAGTSPEQHAVRSGDVSGDVSDDVSGDASAGEGAT